MSRIHLFNEVARTCTPQRWPMLCLALLVLVASSEPCFSFQAHPEPIGMILQTRGRTNIKRKAGTRRIAFGELLYTDDRIFVRSGEISLLFCPTGEKLVARSPAVLELSKSRVHLLGGVSPIRISSRCSLPEIALGKENLEGIGKTIVRESLEPVSLYLGGKLASSRPRFEWGRVAGAVSYHALVKSESRPVIWESRSGSSSVAYPESLPPLADGFYLWEVRAEAKGKTLAGGTAMFEVRHNSNFTGKTGLAFGDQFLRAIEFENAGYYAEAAALLRGLRDTYGQDEKITRRLAWEYARSGLNAAATEERQRLKPSKPR